MNLDTVIENLNRTISGKEALQLVYEQSPGAENKLIAYMIEINVSELKRIRVDLDQVRNS